MNNVFIEKCHEKKKSEVRVC